MNVPPRMFQTKSKVTLSRALSKLGFSSRSKSLEIICSGRVAINGRTEREPERWVDLERDRITVDGRIIRAPEKVYLMLNKPRGLVTTTDDERGRQTVFECLANAGLPRVMPIGRLDQASEGLLLFTNDTKWIDRIAAPESRLEKVYHVQIDRLAEAGVLLQIQNGISDAGEFLRVNSANVVRQGERNCWLEIRLHEGKNRHIRRLLAAFDIQVLRLVRVSIGPLSMGNLEKGKFRFLSPPERQAVEASFPRGKPSYRPPQRKELTTRTGIASEVRKR